MTTVGWMDIFSRKECKHIIIDSLKYCQEKKGLIINAYVLMESHLHMIARADEPSKGLSAIIRDFKKHTSKQLIDWVMNSGKESRKEWIGVVMKYHA
jgi:REP element-mobilizing transposase RayT